MLLAQEYRSGRRAKQATFQYLQLVLNVHWYSWEYNVKLKP